MGYLNNATTVLDAVLTKKGRELLARGQNEFQITKFALADDEVDYSLWNETNPLGTDYYGNIIESLPLLEPTANANTTMRYKLVTREAGTNKMSSIYNVEDSYTVDWNAGESTAGGGKTITPNSKDLPGNSDTDEDGYSFTILNSSIAYLSTAGSDVAPSNINYSTSKQNMSQTVYGTECTVHAKEILQSQDNATTTIIITGLTYGATRACTVKVNYLASASGNSSA
jgi:hypothetical protein